MDRPCIAYTCSYTPLPLLEAGGFTPWRLLPVTSAPERAGSLLHDNVCPLVKRMLDRAFADDLPALAGIVVMASCETMRRFADAWSMVRAGVPSILVDLPLAATPAGVESLAGELRRLGGWLETLGGRPVEPSALAESIAQHNLRAAALAENPPTRTGTAGVPVMLTGNMLPDPEAFTLLRQCGLQVVADDLCTGSRQLTVYPRQRDADPLLAMARGLLERPPCARTLVAGRPGDLGERVVAQARAAGARGVVAHVLKFCDPYLGRLPLVRDALRKAGLPLLVLEGDCTLRSLGQYRTRLEAFAETLMG